MSLIIPCRLETVSWDGLGLPSLAPPRLMNQRRAMNGDILRRQVTVLNPQGLHIRPASAFVQCAEKLAGTVIVVKGEQRVNGKSLWDLLLLAAEQGTELVLEVSGEDAAALDRLAELLSAPGAVSL